MKTTITREYSIKDLLNICMSDVFAEFGFDESELTSVVANDKDGHQVIRVSGTKEEIFE